MARKNHPVEYEGQDSVQLTKEATVQKGKIHHYTVQINKLNEQLTSANGTKANIQDSFGKNSDYTKASKKADKLQKQANDAQNRAKNSKSSEIKQNAQDKYDSLMKQRKQYVAQMDKITNSNSKAKLQMAKANTNISNIQDTIKHVDKIRSGHRDKLSKIQRALSVIDTQRKNKIAKANKTTINQKIKDGGKGYIYIYRADGQSDDVIQLVESDPNESGSVNISTATVDNQLPTASYGVPDSRQSTGTYQLIDGDTMGCDSRASRDAIYKKIINYANTITELRITGFTKWKHAFISSYGKSATAATARNTTTISLTFDFLLLSKIETSHKKKEKSQGKKSKKAGRASKNNPNRKHVVKAKSGDSLVSMAKRMHEQVSDLKAKNNKIDTAELSAGRKVVI